MNLDLYEICVTFVLYVIQTLIFFCQMSNELRSTWTCFSFNILLSIQRFIFGSVVLHVFGVFVQASDLSSFK